MDGIGVLVGVVVAAAVIAVALLGFEAGQGSVRSNCETYGKARVGSAMLTCTVSK